MIIQHPEAISSQSAPTRNVPCLGNIVNGEMQLDSKGMIAEQCLQEIPNHFVETDVDIFQVMPNHVHAVLFIRDRGHNLGNIVGSYKASVTRRIRAVRGQSAGRIWEWNYYEHIIRDEDSLSRIRKYILNNPLKWELDRYNPAGRDILDGDDWSDVMHDM